MTRRLTLNTRILGLMLALTLLAGAFTVLTPGTAEALPNYETHTWYYSNAAHTTLVGERHLFCDGSKEGSWGVTSSYKVASTPYVCSTYPF